MKILIDTHTHTIGSGHAYSTIMENANFAKSIGLTHLAMTDHAPDIKNSTSNSYFLNIHAIPDNLFGVRILKGVELNILDEKGTVDLDKGILRNLEINIASLHMPRLKNKKENELTEICMRVMENPLIDIMGHLGDPRYPVDFERIMKHSKETGTLIEINNTSLKPNTPRIGSEKGMREIISIAKRDSIPLVLGSDAHFATDIGNLNIAIDLLKELDFPEKLVLNTEPDKLISKLKKRTR